MTQRLLRGPALCQSNMDAGFPQDSCRGFPGNRFNEVLKQAGSRDALDKETAEGIEESPGTVRLSQETLTTMHRAVPGRNPSRTKGALLEGAFSFASWRGKAKTDSRDFL